MAVIEKRKKTLEQKKSALKALSENPQFCTPQLWIKVDHETVEKIQNAINKSQKTIIKRQIIAKEKELTQLRENEKAIQNQ